VKRAYTIVSWVAVVVWMGALFISSSHPVPEKVGLIPDKVLHFAAYFALGLLYVNALTNGFAKPMRWREALLAIGLSTIFGVFDEWHQSYVPTRSMSFLDVVFDFLGSSSAAACLLCFRRIRNG
jgi:VanZ family protein